MHKKKISVQDWSGVNHLTHTLHAGPWTNGVHSCNQTHLNNCGFSIKILMVVRLVDHLQMVGHCINFYWSPKRKVWANTLESPLPTGLQLHTKPRCCELFACSWAPTNSGIPNFMVYVIPLNAADIACSYPHRDTNSVNNRLHVKNLILECIFDHINFLSCLLCELYFTVFICIQSGIVAEVEIRKRQCSHL